MRSLRFGIVNAKVPFFTLLTSCLLAGCSSASSYMMVAVPVADLRAQPHTHLQRGIQDSLQETQLLFGERVRVIKSENDWSYIEALEQPEYSHSKRWQGYPGWVPSSILVPWQEINRPNIVVTQKWVQTWDDFYLVKKSAWQFPMGTQLYARDFEALWEVRMPDGGVVWIPYKAAKSFYDLSTLSVDEKRSSILLSAEKLIGDDYVWGGRSPHPGGVDCSGLVNLAYRTVGIDIPRDAHEQFLRAKKINQLQPGDLIFLSKKSDPKHIVHVMLYAGEGSLIEGPATGKAVHRIALSDRLGRSIDELTTGNIINEQTVYFGSYLE